MHAILIEFIRLQCVDLCDLQPADPLSISGAVLGNDVVDDATPTAPPTRYNVVWTRQQATCFSTCFLPIIISILTTSAYLSPTHPLLRHGVLLHLRHAQYVLPRAFGLFLLIINVAFSSLLSPYEHMTFQCQNCGNFSAKLLRRWCV